MDGGIEIPLGPVTAHPLYALYGIGQKHLVGDEHVLWSEVALVHLHAKLQGNVDDFGAHDACSGSAVQTGRVQHPIGHQEEVGRSALNDPHAVVLDQGSIEVLLLGPQTALNVNVGCEVLEARQVVRRAFHLRIDVHR